MAVESGRLRFVTTQPEERLQLPFLESVFERKSTAMLGRRTTAALIVADVVRTADISFLNDSATVAAMVEVAHLVSEVEGVPLQKVLRGFLWPLASRRDGLQGLLVRGSKAGPAMGLADLLSARLQAKSGLDVELETRIFSEAVHIGHALNATVFGPLNEPPAFTQLKCWIGRHLNFHKNFNEQSSAMWLKNEERLASGKDMLPTIPLFDFDKLVSIQEILEDSALGSVRSRGRGLYTRLANLSSEERSGEIERLNELLRKRARRQSKQEIALDIADIGISVVDLIIGLFVPPVSAIGRFSKPLIERARGNRRVDSVIMKLEDKMKITTESQDLEFLSRVSRVATFKVDRV